MDKNYYRNIFEKSEYISKITSNKSIKLKQDAIKKIFFYAQGFSKECVETSKESNEKYICDYLKLRFFYEFNTSLASPRLNYFTILEKEMNLDLKFYVFGFDDSIHLNYLPEDNKTIKGRAGIFIVSFLISLVWTSLISPFLYAILSLFKYNAYVTVFITVQFIGMFYEILKYKNKDMSSLNIGKVLFNQLEFELNRNDLLTTFD